MKNFRLEELLRGVDCISINGNKECMVCGLSFDSRKIEKGWLFFAVSGTACDGHKFIGSAIESGACAVVCEHLPEQIDENVCYVVCNDTNKAMGEIAANFYDHPSTKLKLVGVTGTNGKTTTATLLYHLFRGLGYKAGLISTVVYIINGREIPSTHTTPDSLRLNEMLDEMVETGCDYCFMEVSSHSIAQERIGALHFAGALFTNITHDHLDYHKTFAEYLSVKKRLFDGLDKGAFALTNLDDKNGEVVVQNTRAGVKTYSLRGIGDYNCKVIEMTLDGMLLEVDGKQVWVRLIGRFNAYNILSVYSIAMELGADRHEVLTVISTLHSVNGRFEYMKSPNGVTAIVDYAHTPDALEKVLDTIHTLGCCNKVTVVVGCGGDRDKTKRPEMGQIAVEKADRAIFTSDNPRGEDPDEIIREICEGVGAKNNYLCITDRRAAIRTAVMTAEEGDIVLVAGKGHEDYQIIGTEKHHFSDKEEIKKLFDTIK